MSQNVGKFKKDNNKKKKYNRFLISFLLLAIPLIVLLIGDILHTIEQNGSDKNGALYKFIPGDTEFEQRFFLNNMNLIGLLIGFLIGLFLTYILTYFYLLIMKKFFKVKTVGLAKKTSDRMPLKTFISRVIIAALLTASFIFIFLENEFLAKFWWKDLDDYNYYLKHQSEGKYSEYFHLPWQWIAITITIILLIPCWTILDSGLVLIKEIEQYDNFKETDRVGNYFYDFVKGYVGISIVITWIIMILTLNVGLAVLPINTLVYFLPFVAALDLINGFSRKLVTSAASKVYELKLIDIEINKSDLKDILKKRELRNH